MKNNEKKFYGTPVASGATDSEGYSKRSRVTIIVVCSVLAAIIAFGAIFGGIIAARDASYLMEYDGVGIDTGVASYLTSYFKSRYISYLNQSGVSVTDSESFWNSPSGVLDNTYGDYLEYETKDYIKQLIAANVLFDRYAKLSDSDESAIDAAVKEILDFRHGGSKSEFNAATVQYGFDYDDFCRATEMLYKAWAAKVKIFGTNGSNMGAFAEYRDEFLGEYSRVKLLFVRTENKFVTDENGNRVKGDDGYDLTVDLTDEEKAERQARIEEIRAALAGISDGTVAPERFDELLASDYNEGDRSVSARNGYYFNKNSDFTIDFYEALPDVVEKSLSMSVSETAEVDCGFAVCFIYKEPVAEGAYENTDEAWCFSDFNVLAAESLYEQMLKELSAEVDVRDKWSDISPIKIPYQTDYNARF